MVHGTGSPASTIMMVFEVPSWNVAGMRLTFAPCMRDGPAGAPKPPGPGMPNGPTPPGLNGFSPLPLSLSKAAPGPSKTW
jgi:hypothetical protein